MKRNKNETRKHLLFTNTSSIYSEAFQHLQVNLDFSFVGQASKVVAITSPLPTEGKSTIVSNLAYIYAKKDFKVCLLDLDLRKPTIHRFFNLDNDLGITDYCAGKASKKDIVKSFENLTVITSGTLSPFPGKILESDALLSLINELEKEYDYVFIDTPPVLASSDALLMSKFVGQYILVVKYGKTKKNDLDETIRQFNNNNLEIAGVVFDSVALDKEKGYSYKYRYQYGKK